MDSTSMGTIEGCGGLVRADCYEVLEWCSCHQVKPGVTAAVQSREGSATSQMSLPLLPPSFTLRHNEVADSTLPEATVVKVSSHQLKRMLQALDSITTAPPAHMQLLTVVWCKKLPTHTIRQPAARAAWLSRQSRT